MNNFDCCFRLDYIEHRRAMECTCAYLTDDRGVPCPFQEFSQPFCGNQEEKDCSKRVHQGIPGVSQI